MKHILMTIAVFGCLGGSAMAENIAKTPMALGIQGDGLYSFATSATQKNGVIGGEIENITDKALKIIRAESDVAERVELHTHLMDDGVMMMREVESYDVDANDDFELGPRAEHIMLFGLKAPLKQGSVFSVRLYDDKGASIEVPVLVRAPGDIPDKEEDDDAGMKHDSDHQEHKH